MNGVAGSGGKEKEKEGDLAGSFQRCVLDHIRETVLMYIHRSFFAQAIIEHPANPLKSAYAPSFLAAYRASSTILKSVREQFGVWPTSCARFWTMWTFAFSAAVVFGTVVTRGPRSPLAQSAMAELEQACILFTKASVYSIRCTKALAILTKLAEKARHALAGVQKDPSQLSDGGGLHWGLKIKQEETEEDDELAIFAGHTRFVSAKKPATAEVPLPVYPAPAPPPTAQQHHPLHQQEYQPQAHSRPSAAPVPSMAGGWSAAEDGYMAVSRPEDHVPPPPPSVSHYSYVPSERTHQVDTYNGGAGGGSASGWEDERRSCPQQSYPPAMPIHPPRTVPSQYPTQYPLPPTQPPLPYQQHQPAYRAPPPPEQYQQYQAYPTHPLQNQHGWESRQQHPYPHAHPAPPPVQHQHHQPAFHTQAQHLPNAELADLGLASRDSRLDERWSLFMQDSGLLEGLDFRGR
ncbi:putative fungal specific transcription factor [Lyophyllum shimeji]|uniref:Fungal specific transcription factor n=1 Tax=Lyophyllum shimeji TaxID=47721 RepID=A0A9P3Q1B4_LYOSH|nr:putative fungal specific transcription factor [Lyophyllum shimeji]